MHLRQLTRFALVLLLGAGCESKATFPQKADAGRDSATNDATLTDAATDAVSPIDAGPDPIEAAITELKRSDLSETLADQLLTTIGRDQGWPLRHGARWLFVTRWESAPPAVALVGDFNDWNTTKHPANPTATNKHYWVVVEHNGVDPAGKKYKWWASPDTWRAPPEATAYTFDDNGEVGFVASPKAAGWLERFPGFHATALSAPRMIRASLPAGFVKGSAAAKQYRTALFHDGQNVFNPNAPWGGWKANETLASGKWPKVIALAVDNAIDRFDAYSHVIDLLPGESNPIGGKADAYLALLRDQVLPFFRARYGIVAAGKSLMVVGGSLGGLVSLYQAMSQPGEIGCAAGMSPSLGWGAYDKSADGSATLIRRWPQKPTDGPAIYLDSGGASPNGGCKDNDGDGIFEDANDSDNYCVTTQLRDVLAQLGYTHQKDLFHWHEPDALHNEAAWAARLSRAFDACDSGGWRVP